MQDEKTYVAEYKKGFNQGYLIAQHLPDLATQLASVKNTTPQIEGFQDGRNEFLQEKEIGKPLEQPQSKFLQRDEPSPEPEQPSKEIDDLERE
jgi:hypothetical protein